MHWELFLNHVYLYFIVLLACLIIYPIVLVLIFTRSCDVALHWGSGILYHLVGNLCFWILVELVDDNSTFCRRCVFYIMVITKKIKKIQRRCFFQSWRRNSKKSQDVATASQELRDEASGRLSSLAAWLRRGFPMTDWWWSTTCIHTYNYIYIYLKNIWPLTIPNPQSSNFDHIPHHPPAFSTGPGSFGQAGWSPLHVAAFMGRQDAVSVAWASAVSGGFGGFRRWKDGKMMENIGYPLVNIQKAIEHGH